VTAATLTADREARSNSAYAFSSGLISFGNPSQLQLTKGTVSAWIKTASPGSSYRGIVTKQYAYGMFLQDSLFCIYDWTTAGPRCTTSNLADNTWHHVVMSFSTGVTNGTTLYVDGVAKLTTTMTINNQSVNVVAGDGSYPSAGQNFNGSIDDVRIWNRALSAIEVTALYNEYR
jgi:hypothetical protein